MKKYLKEPLITLTIEIDRDKFAQIHIHEDSNPEQLAEQFIAQHRLNNSYKEPLKQNIIQQMLLYDKMKDTPKEIIKEPQPILQYKKVPNKENQFSTPKRQRKSTEKLITQIKAQNKPAIRQKTSKSPQKLVLKSPRLNQLCKNKSFEFMPIPKAEVKISILENEESVTQLPKESPNVSFSEESQFQNDNIYTSDQVENSLQNLLKDNDNRIISKLFNIMQTDKCIDPRNIPYEKFNYQLIVEIRKHFAKHQFRTMDQKDFTETAKKNHILIKVIVFLLQKLSVQPISFNYDTFYFIFIINTNMFKSKIVYYYDEEFGTFNYSTSHPMKPIRVAITDDLVHHYGLHKYMDSIDQDYVQEYIKRVNEDILTTFHSQEYIDLIKIITPENKCQYEDQLYRFNFMEDCPVLDRLYDFCLCQTAGTVAAACQIASQKHEIAINWSGGLHHAKQSEASGFCYVNDCVIGILELLKTYQRVLYVDIDIHHGDGVEEAFYLTNRVMTCSFHKFKEYFPGTGHIDDIGHNEGKYHAVNFPLNEGLDDENLQYIFKPVLTRIMENFQPDVIMLQGGSDSLSGDRLGCFNLSIKGHGSCLEFLKTFNVPLILVGGGGYTLRNVPRCWTYETGIACNQVLKDAIPEESEYRVYFGPEYKLHLPISNMEEQNNREYLDKHLQQLLENLKNVNNSGVQISNYQTDKLSQQKIDYHELFSSQKDKREEMNKDNHTDNNNDMS